jgi:hypothetical protein
MSLEGSIHYRMRIQHVEAAVPNTVWVACNEDYSVTEVSRHPKVSSSCAQFTRPYVGSPKVVDWPRA